MPPLIIHIAGIVTLVSTLLTFLNAFRGVTVQGKVSIPATIIDVLACMTISIAGWYCVTH